MRKLPAAIATAMSKAGVKPRRGKYNIDNSDAGKAERTVDGIRFDSKAEAEFYQRLKVNLHIGNVSYFLMQVSFHLPGGYRHKVDFMTVTHAEFFPDDERVHVEFYEIKGMDVATGKMKRKQVEELYGIKIHVLHAVYQRGVIVDFQEVE